MRSKNWMLKYYSG